MEGFGQTETVIAVANLVGSEPKPGSWVSPCLYMILQLLMKMEMLSS